MIILEISSSLGISLQEVCVLHGQLFVTSQLTTVYYFNFLKRLVTGTLLDVLSLLAD
jgi:hypothetical protein